MLDDGNFESKGFMEAVNIIDFPELVTGIQPRHHVTIRSQAQSVEIVQPVFCSHPQHATAVAQCTQCRVVGQTVSRCKLAHVGKLSQHTDQSTQT